MAKGQNKNNGGGDFLFFVIKNKNRNRRIISTGSVCFSGGLYCDKNTEIIIKNIFDQINYTTISFNNKGFKITI